MPYKDPAKQKEAQRRHYERFREKYIAAGRAGRAYRDKLANEAKDRPCAECGGVFHPAVMCFHHIDPETKLHNIGALRANGSRKALLAEIAKCAVVCANCHAMLHVEMRAASRDGESSN